jgi:hypothetical protein
VILGGVNMAITLSTTARNAANNATTALVNGGNLVILQGATVLCTIPLSATAFGSSTNGAATANGLPLSASASGTGTADSYRVENSSATSIWTGTVGVGTGDLQLTSLSINSGQTVTVTSWTHTQPA